MTDTRATPVDAERVRAGAGRGWGPVEVVAQTGSTNADLVARCALADRIGTVLIAEEQIAGRGRLGRRWQAAPGTQLAMSMVVDAAGRDGDARDGLAALGWIPLLTGIAVQRAVARVTGVQAGVKWPNDVLVGGLKVAGILAELAHGPRPSVVIGVGINTGMAADELPVPTATSLNLETGRPVDRTELAAALLTAMTEVLARWPHDTVGLAHDYRSVCVTLGTRVRVDLPADRVLTGLAVDIDPHGRIVIDPDPDPGSDPDPDMGGGAEPVAVAAGDVTHLRPER